MNIFNINDTHYLLHNAHKIMQCGMCLRHDSNPICALPKFRKPRKMFSLLVLHFQPQHKNSPPMLSVKYKQIFGRIDFCKNQKGPLHVPALYQRRTRNQTHRVSATLGREAIMNGTSEACVRWSSVYGGLRMARLGLNQCGVDGDRLAPLCESSRSSAVIM